MQAHRRSSEGESMSRFLVLAAFASIFANTRRRCFMFSSGAYRAVEEGPDRTSQNAPSQVIDRRPKTAPPRAEETRASTRFGDSIFGIAVVVNRAWAVHCREAAAAAIRYSKGS